MQSTPTRSVRTRRGGGLSQTRDNRARTSSNGANLNERSSHAAIRGRYTDLDRAPMPIENYLTQKRRSSEKAKRRVCRQPEGFLTADNSSFAVITLPRVAATDTSAGEESILKKWEAWSTQMGTQLALEGAVPATPAARAISQNSSFRSASQLSNSSFSKPHAGSARGFSPLSQSGRRSVSRGSSRSRQSSLASTVVEPFKVGERMTASAERRRPRPKSTQASRELLFRRALGLEEEKDAVQNASFASAPRGSGPTPGPLIAFPKPSGVDEHASETRSTPREESKLKSPGFTDPPLPSKDVLRPPPKSASQDAAEVAKEGAASPSESDAIASVSSKTAVLAKANSKGEEWLKKSVALLNAKDHPFTEVVEEEARPAAEQACKNSTVQLDVKAHTAKQKWHLPLGEAAQMTCGRVVVRLIGKSEVLHIGCRAGGIENPDGEVDNAPMHTAVIPTSVVWPIDRASVKVLFEDHHVSDGQCSVYGVEVASREDCSPEVLPDWNESRRRFAPVALPDSQPPH